jgi:uncharacterized phage protein (TIGR01671 family)
MSVREIKFRGKTITTGEWVYGYYVKARELHYILPFYNKDNFDERYHLEGTDEFGWYEVDPKTVGQFTGLFDKNGKEIYEGDIIKGLRDGSIDYSDIETQVVFRNGAFVETYFGICIGNYINVSFGFGNVLEVIGNIYETR